MVEGIKGTGWNETRFGDPREGDNLQRNFSAGKESRDITDRKLPALIWETTSRNTLKRKKNQIG